LFGCINYIYGHGRYRCIASKPYNLSAISNIILFPEWNYITLSSDSILKKKLNRQEKDRPHSIALKKKPKPTEKTPEPWLHPIGPHRNLGRPWPIVLAALQLPPSRRVQTNHKCYRPVPRHFFFGLPARVFAFVLPPGFEPWLVSSSTGKLTFTLQECRLPMIL